MTKGELAMQQLNVAVELVKRAQVLLTEDDQSSVATGPLDDALLYVSTARSSIFTRTAQSNPIDPPAKSARED